MEKPLRGMETWEGGLKGYSYDLPLLGAELLASYAGEDALLRLYMLQRPGTTWQEAFQSAFGMTVGEFYQLFEEHVAADFPDPNRPTPTGPQAVDDYIPIPDRPRDQAFLMPIEDVFGIKGRGTVVTGRVERGIIGVGQQIEIVGIKDTTTTTVTGVEMFHKTLDEGEPGDAVGVLLRGVDREGVERGQVLAAPGSITPHTEAKAQVYVLSRGEGGRHTPFFAGYKPQFYIRTTDVTGEIRLPDGVEMVMPGDNIEMTVKLITPVAMDEQLRFAVREGGRTVGSGVITQIIT